MAASKRESLLEAVFFFGPNKIINEMRYAEFEALLDGVVGMSNFASSEIKAVYLQISSKLLAQSLVFFVLPFDARGYIEQSWNSPLRKLADTSGVGPDLGGGAIRLSCRSQCTLAWQKKALWEPQNIHYQQIKEAINRNKLGFVKAKSPSQPSPDVNNLAGLEGLPLLFDNIDAQGQAIARSSKVHQQELSVIEAEHLEEISSLKRAMRNETQSYKSQVEELRLQIRQHQVLFDKLKAGRTRLEKERLAIKEQLDIYKTRYQEIKEEHLALLKEDNTADRLRLTALETKLADKDSTIEKLYQQLNDANQETDRISQQNAELQQNDAPLEELIEKMERQELVFVAYHPGAGHISMPVRQLVDYLDKPLAFAAQKCGVTLDQYSAWLVHYDSRECLECSVPVKRIEQPADFRKGYHDHCPRHRSHSDSNMSAG